MRLNRFGLAEGSGRVLLKEFGVIVTVGTGREQIEKFKSTRRCCGLRNSFS